MDLLYDPHLGRISKPIRLPLDLVFLMGAVDQVVTGLTQSNQVIRMISTGFS